MLYKDGVGGVGGITRLAAHLQGSAVGRLDLLALLARVAHLALLALVVAVRADDDGGLGKWWELYDSPASDDR